MLYVNRCYRFFGAMASGFIKGPTLQPMMASHPQFPPVAGLGTPFGLHHLDSSVGFPQGKHQLFVLKLFLHSNVPHLVFKPCIVSEVACIRAFKQLKKE